MLLTDNRCGGQYPLGARNDPLPQCDTSTRRHDDTTTRQRQLRRQHDNPPHIAANRKKNRNRQKRSFSPVNSTPPQPQQTPMRQALMLACCTAFAREHSSATAAVLPVLVTMRIVTTGGVLLAVPHVAGFVAGPTVCLVPTSALPQPSAFSLRSPHQAQAVVRTAPRRHRHRHGAAETLTAAESVWCSQEGFGCSIYRRRQRQLWVTPAASATTTGAGTTTSTSSLPAARATILVDHDHHDDEPSSSDAAASAGVGMGLQLAVIGLNADELGLRMAERHGLLATSMDELMKGRKGRRTDAVKAKAVSKWLAEKSAGEVVDSARKTRIPETQFGDIYRTRDPLS